MSSESLVSVLLCTYNASDYIENTLASITAQTYENMEILVLDNASKDDTVEKVRAHQEHDSRIELFEGDENLGAYPGINYLLEEASGDYVAIQDHDDIWHERKVEMQVQFLDESPEFVGCGGNTIKLWEGTERIYRISFDEVSDRSPHPSLMFRNDGSRYDTSFTYKADMYFMQDILCGGEKKLYNFQKPLYISLVRDDGNNMTTTRTPLRDILSYAVKAGAPKTFLNQLRHYVLPSLNYPSNHIDGITREGDFESVNSLAESEFTSCYLQFIDDYVDADIKTAVS